MARLESAAAWAGVGVGLWAFVAAYYGVGGAFGAPTLSMGAILAVVSFFCMVGPRVAFYGSALLALLLAASMVIASPNDVGIATVGLALVESALSILAARRRVGVSEQSHPMNLPVFG